jgi:RNA polymerase sigma-70 factor (ECF subfamily)
MQISPERDVGAARRQPGNETDDGLIRLIAGGDRSAMHELYARHHVRVYRFIARITRDSQLAEDTLGDVFLDVWRTAGRFAHKSQVGTWLLSIARHKAINRLRAAQAASLRFAPLEEAAAVAEPAAGPDAAFGHDERGAALRTCLGSLSPIHRQIVELVYFQSKSTQEAAEIVGIPRATVKTRMFNARHHLGKLLRQAGVQSAYA